MAITATAVTAAAATTTPNLAFGFTANAGDLLIIAVGEDGAGTCTWPSPWVELRDGTFTGAAAYAGYLIATGGETSVTLTGTVNDRWEGVLWRIPAGEWHGVTAPQITTGATGSSVNPNPPSITPSWGAETGNIYIAVCYRDDSVANTITAYPTNYSTAQLDNNATTSGCNCGGAVRIVNTSPEDPGTFTISASETWLAVTIAVRPASAGLSVSPALLGGASQFSPTLTPGNVNVSPALLGGATIATPAFRLSVSMPLVGSPASLFTPAPEQIIIHGAILGSPATLFDPNIGARVSPPFLDDRGLASSLPLLLGPIASPSSQVFAPHVGVPSVHPALLGGGSLFTPSFSIQNDPQNLALPLIRNGLFDPAIFDPALFDGGTSIFEPVVSRTTTAQPSLLGGGTLFSPSLSVGPVSVSPPVLGGGTTFSPTVAPAGISVAPALLGGGVTFAPMMAQAASVSPALINQTAVIFAPVMTVTGIQVYPDLLGGYVLYAPGSTPGGVTLTPNRIDQAGVTFAPTLSSTVTVSPTVLGGHVLNTPIIVAPAIRPALLGGHALHAPTLSVSEVSVQPELIDQTAVLYDMELVPGGTSVLPGLINQAAILFAPALLTGVVAPFIDQTTVLFTPSISGGSIVIAGYAPVAMATNLVPVGAATHSKPER